MCSTESPARPYVDRPPGDLQGARRLAARAASDLQLPPPTLTNVGMNAIFRAGDVVLRVGRPTASPASSYDVADVLTTAGIRVAQPAGGRPVIVETDGTDQPLVATAWDWLEATGEQADWAEVGAMVRILHGLAPSAVPHAYPVPRCTTFPWWQFDELVQQVEGSIDAASRRALGDTIERHRGWVQESGGPDEWVLCHGDVHPANVIATRDGPVIIDWDLLATGPPGWDHAPLRSMIRHWGYPFTYYDQFADGYGADLAHDPVTVALTDLRAVAATIMRVIAGRQNRAAKVEAERRLRYWRGDPDAPTWAMS